MVYLGISCLIPFNTIKLKLYTVSLWWGGGSFIHFIWGNDFPSLLFITRHDSRKSQVSEMFQENQLLYVDRCIIWSKAVVDILPSLQDTEKMITYWLCFFLIQTLLQLNYLLCFLSFACILALDGTVVGVGAMELVGCAWWQSPTSSMFNHTP